ncbi:MAG: Rrf2 family transcriptional regulator [Calditrichaeota bacterium]|nr:MAG: Rrf2 family transcriptional regulator [Calditrichota bacterium]
MTQFLNSRAVYALRAMIFIAWKCEERDFIPVREIAKALDLSFSFLAKIIGQLVEQGLLVSHRGPAGGVGLARPADQINLAEILWAVEGEDYLEGCLLQLPGCEEATPCPIHDQWSKIREQIKQVFVNTSLKELATKVQKEGLRLADLPFEKY